MRTIARSLRHLRSAVQYSNKCNYSGAFRQTRKHFTKASTGTARKLIINAELDRFPHLPFSITRAISVDAAKDISGGCFSKSLVAISLN